jgi:7-cyano-7-deazaguanine synthase in queuosine biosynthesis
MPVPEVLILASGGLRSLVAVAMACAESGALKITLLHVHDGRGHAAARLEYTRRQAKHLGVTQVVEVDLAPAKVRGWDPQADAGARLIVPRVLLAAAAVAAERAVGRILWPAQCDGDADRAARALEQAELVRHLGQLEFADLPAIETPLLELTDAQLIELGGHLEVPWERAWTCLLAGPRACRLCAACRRRRAAFEAVGLTDPGDPASTAAAGSV